MAWAYDPVGVRTNMVDSAGATTWHYDARYRLLQKTRAWSDSGTATTLAYGYDRAGNVTNVISSSTNGVGVHYAYDALNRLSSVWDGMNAVNYAYDQGGNLSSLTRPNGLQTLYAYDSLNRPTNILTIDAASAGLSQYLSVYNAAGSRMASAEALVHGGQTNLITRSYAYDPLYRLTAETIAGTSFPAPHSAAYSYDAVGNRLTRSSTVPGLPNQSFSYDANDQLASDTYDLNGNTLTSPGSGVTVPDTYDPANRLIARQTPSGAATFQYDGEGNRVGKTVGGLTTHFVVDDVNPTGWPQVLEEQGWKAANPAMPPAVTRVYTYGHTPLSQEQLVGNAWTTSHFGQDTHGNVRYLSDPSGRVTDTYDYDAFGSTIARSGATPATRLFTGEEYDADLGLYHLRARYHNPASGRFWTRDRFEGYKSIPNSQHGYGYAGNNPVTWIDPSGHESMGELMAVTTMVPMVRGMMDHLWSSINSYNYGLGGGSVTAPDRQDQLPVNTAEAMFMQGLSQHRGVNLGRDNFFAAMQGAPFLLAANTTATF